MAGLSNLQAIDIIKGIPFDNKNIDQQALHNYLERWIVELATKKSKTSAALRDELIEITRITDDLTKLGIMPSVVESLNNAGEAIAEARLVILAIEKEKESK
jgi:hypothetical protein